MKYTKKLIATKLPQLRALKYYGGKTFPLSKITDEVLINSLYVILNSKGLFDGFEVLDDDYGHSIESNSMMKGAVSNSVLEKIKKEKFNLKALYKMACVEAFKATGINEDLPDSFICTFYHTPAREFKKIFPKVDSSKLYENYSLRGEIINKATEYVSKNRNIPGVKLAKDYATKDLIGKYVVTENNVLSGFMKKSMTLKYVGYLPGKISETRHGERHGIDNFWDERVEKRDFLVLDIVNSTKAKEIEKWKEKKYAIDITDTLQVFDTLDEALEIANQLNEFHKKSLTLNY